MIKFKSLNQSKQFLKILKKKRINTKYFTIYFEKNLINENKKYKPNEIMTKYVIPRTSIRFKECRFIN